MYIKPLLLIDFHTSVTAHVRLLQVMNYFHVAEHMRGIWMANVSNYVLSFTYAKVSVTAAVAQQYHHNNRLFTERHSMALLLLSSTGYVASPFLRMVPAAGQRRFRCTRPLNLNPRNTTALATAAQASIACMTSTSKIWG